VDEAFEKGRIEGARQKAADFNSINVALEQKEQRITDLVLENSELNKKIKDLEIAVEDAKAQANQVGGGIMSLFNEETGMI